MKITKLVAAAGIALFSFSLFAQETENRKSIHEKIEEHHEEFKEKPRSLSFDVGVDFAYYPQSDFIKEGDHYAPLTGAYSGLEGRITPAVTYKIGTPMGENWLVNSADLQFKAAMEITPVSICPTFNATWTPLPFFVLNTGAQFGTGWEMIGIQGMATLFDDNGNPEFNDDGTGFVYHNASPFEDWMIKWWAQATVQFDAAALWPGEWHHIVALYTYQVYYNCMTGAKDGEVWLWNAGGNRANGWVNWQSAIIGYQMPIAMNMVGIWWEMEGHYNSSDFDEKYFPGYDGSFKSMSISPLAQFKLTPKDSLSCMISFASRQSFKEDHEDGTLEPILTSDGTEWYFKRIALSYSHKFF